MKQIFTILLAAVLLLSLAACGVDQESAVPAEPNAPAESNTPAEPDAPANSAVTDGPAFIGSWAYSYTNDKNTVVSKSFEVRADNTATIMTTEAYADGSVEEKTVDYTWELNENGQVVIRSEKHTAVFNFSQENDTLTNRNATAEKFVRTSAAPVIDSSADNIVLENDATVVIGKWVLKAKTPDGITSIQYLVFNEDGSGSYQSLNVDASGVETQENAYDFEWVYENGEFVCSSKKYTDYYFYTAEDNTLTDQHSHGRVFKPANE